MNLNLLWRVVMVRCFNYVIAYKLENSDSLNCFNYYGENVFFGSEHDAQVMLKYVKEKRKDGPSHHHYKIYEINVND